MTRKILTTVLFIFLLGFQSQAQRIVVDSASTTKYLISSPENISQTIPPSEQELSFSDRALSIGKGILNRLKARFNLEEAGESLKRKKDQILGIKEEDKKIKVGEN